MFLKIKYNSELQVVTCRCIPFLLKFKCKDYCYLFRYYPEQNNSNNSDNLLCTASFKSLTQETSVQAGMRTAFHSSVLQDGWIYTSCSESGQDYPCASG